MVASSRQDLSEWALHFIHDRNIDNEPDDQMIDFSFYDGYPYHENRDVNSRFDFWNVVDEESNLAVDGSAFAVLLKIIRDGHIRASWAFRNRRPTVYGPRAAVCFTEMPLYALVDYSRNRGPMNVGNYAVGVLRHELFASGGRPVIYGLSGKHIEQRPEALSSNIWPRKLHPSCGLVENEQYRYVAMSTDAKKPIDWSHEREWRWVDHKDLCSCPGLPVWLDDEPIGFSRIFVMVQNSTEVERILDLLKELHDAGANDYDWPFSRSSLERTQVVALDQLRQRLTDTQVKTLRFDDIPKSEIEIFEHPEVSEEYVKSVKSVLMEAQHAANTAAESYLETAPRDKHGHVTDVSGWAYLMVYDAQSPLVSALLKLDCVDAVPGKGYMFKDLGGLGWRGEQALSVAEVAINAAKKTFKKYFPDAALGIKTRWD